MPREYSSFFLLETRIRCYPSLQLRSSTPIAREMHDFLTEVTSPTNPVNPLKKYHNEMQVKRRKLNPNDQKETCHIYNTTFSISRAQSSHF